MSHLILSFHRLMLNVVTSRHSWFSLVIRIWGLKWISKTSRFQLIYPDEETEAQRGGVCCSGHTALSEVGNQVSWLPVLSTLIHIVLWSLKRLNRRFFRKILKEISFFLPLKSSKIFFFQITLRIHGNFYSSTSQLPDINAILLTVCPILMLAPFSPLHCFLHS